MSKELYQKESNIFLKNILDDLLINPMKVAPANFNDPNVPLSKLELFITPECNLKCTYCYLNNYGEKLYSSNIRDKNTIIKNLELILKMCHKQQLHPKQLELMSGEIWYSDFGIIILNIILDFYKKYGIISKTISIPSNMSFINYPEFADIIQNIIDEFTKLGVRMYFSASIDGKIIEDKTRPQKANVINKDDEFYDKVFSFCAKNHFGFHPMIAANGIEYWKENFIWYQEMLKKYNIDPKTSIMTLEVRNNDWTDEKIESYIDYLEFLWNYTYSGIDDDKIGFKIIDDLIGNSKSYKNTTRIYNILHLDPYTDKIDCGLQERLTVRLGDLAIVPCHRTSYDKFVIGKYIVENDEIVDIKAINPEIALAIFSMNPVMSCIKCGACIYNKLCMKQCFGANIEANNEILNPCDTVCKLFKRKIDFLVNKYIKYGVLEKLSTSYKWEGIRLYSILNEFITLRDKEVKLDDK